MEKLKKALLIVSLSTLGIAVAMLISGVLGVPIFSNQIIFKILLTLATISITSGLSINEITVIKRKKILGFVGLALLLASATLAIIMFIVPSLFANTTMVKATSIVALVSLMFVTIISNYSKLQSSLIAFQIIAYLVLVAFNVLISLLIAGVNILALPGMIEVFIIVCILTVGFLIALAVLGAKRNAAPEVQHKFTNLDEDKMLVSKAEYYSLKEENQKLKEQKVDEDKMIISKAEYYTLKEDNLKLKEELMKLKQGE